MGCHRKHYESSPAHEQYKFYKHLRVYLTVVGITMFVNLFGRGQFHIPSFAMWWGLGVAIHYLNVFGWDSLFQQDGAPERTFRDRDYDEEYDEPEPLVDMREREPRRQWRDRDLV